MKKISTILITLVLVIVCLAPPPAQGGYLSEKQIKEYRLKAAYLLNFAKFTSWPDKTFPTPQTPFVIGVLGTNPFGKALKPLSSRKVNGRPIKLRYFTDMEQIKPCQILFISRAAKDALPAILAACHDRPIFTISDIKGFVHQGGMLEFVTVKNHLHFSINLIQVQKHNLKIEAQVLALATEVIKEEP